MDKRLGVCRCAPRAALVCAILSVASFSFAKEPAAKQETRPDPVEQLTRGTSTRAACDVAKKELPLKQLSKLDQQKVERILNSVSVFRELPIVRFPVDPEAHRFFIDHPDVAVSIWKVLGISEFEMWQTGPDKYEVDGNDGTVGVVEMIHRGEDEQIMYCSGQFSSPILPKPIEASAIIHLRTQFSTGPQDQSLATCRLRFFASFPSQPVETAAKIVSPVSNTIIDRNFHETSLFVHMMWKAMAYRPGWVEHIAPQMKNIREQERTELVDLTAKIFVNERKRALSQYMKPGDITLDDVMEPLHSSESAESESGGVKHAAAEKPATTKR